MFDQRFFFPRISVDDETRRLLERDPARVANHRLTRSVDHGVIRPQIRHRAGQPGGAR